MKLATIENDAVDVAVSYKGETLHVTYNAAAYTSKLEESLRRPEEETSQSRILARLLSRLLVKWDLVDAKDKPVKTDEETLAGLPIKFLSAVAKGITEDTSPNSTTTADSGSFS